MAGQTNAYLILSIFTFYTVIFVLMGLIGMGLSSSTIGTPSAPSSYGGILGDIGFFFSGIGFSISNLGIFNTLLFLPLGITILYIILSWMRGSS